MIVYASNAQKFSTQFQKRSQAGRVKFETPRRNFAQQVSNKVLKNIVDDELSFSKSLLKHMIPISVSIDKKAKGFKKIIPLTISFDTDLVGVVDDVEVYTSTDNDRDRDRDNDAVLRDE